LIFDAELYRGGREELFRYKLFASFALGKYYQDNRFLMDAIVGFYETI
jgi:hypothetical protein